MSHDNDQIDTPEPPDDGPIDVPSRAVKRGVDPTFKRNVTILATVVVLALGATGGVVMMLMSKAKPKSQGPEVSMNTTVMPATADDQTPMSPAMRAAAASEAEASFKRQQAEGKRVIMPQEPDNKVVPVSMVASAPVYGYGTAQPMPTQDQIIAQREAEQVRQQQVQQAQQTTQARQEGLQRQIASLVGSRDLGEATTLVSFNVKVTAEATGGAAFPGTRASSAATPTGPEIAGGLELFYAELANDVDTYRTNFCSANIVAGKLQGAYLKGQCTQQDEGLSMHFTLMRFKGQTFAIDATGIDEATASDAMSNINIDHRIFQRYVFPITVAAIGGAATVLSTPPTNTTATGGVVLSSTEAASKDQAIAAGVGAGMTVLQGISQKAAQRPVQITMANGSPMGIMFNKPVRDAL
jgi:hypothetical protein